MKVVCFLMGREEEVLKVGVGGVLELDVIISGCQTLAVSLSTIFKKRLGNILWNDFSLLVPSSQSCWVDWPHGRSSLPERPSRVHHIVMLGILHNGTMI